MREVKVHLFAVLKDIFRKDVVMINATNDTTIGEIKGKLKTLQSETEAVLDSCRIAIDEEFREPEEIIGNAENIYILPPSSGG